MLEEGTQPIVSETIVSQENVTENETVPGCVIDNVTEHAVEVNSSISEPVTSEPDPVVIIQKTFVDLVKKSIETEEIKEKISIKLTPDAVNIINNIISVSPNTLIDVENSMSEVIKDSKIDSNDIPNLIIVIQRIYQFIYSLKNIKIESKKRAELTSLSLKYIIHLLVHEEIIKIDEEKRVEFLDKTNILVESCVGLLIFPKTIKIKNCFKKMF